MICRADRLLIGGGTAIAASVAAFGPHALSVGIPAAGLVGALTLGIARPTSSILYPTRTHGERAGNAVALTFDDGPDPEVTPAVLDLLAQAKAQATFFLIGRLLAQAPALGSRMVAEGHELGNHSWQHARWRNYFTQRAWADDIDRGEAPILAIKPSTSRPIYRPPFGLKTPEFARAATKRDLRVIGWSVHSHDTRIADPQAVAARVLNKVQAGDIILMHDGHDLPGRHRHACPASVKLVLEGLATRGLRSVTVSELLGFGEDK
jgi:peptidoglycan/xylan/chitin deacetylase (PgdA/CDA1 family)